jgi:DNA invertase Pin-like site-specific DNA recombinase
VLTGIKEFEVDMIRERQLEGIALAKERGVYKGRPKKYTEKNKGLQHAIELFNDRDDNAMTVNGVYDFTRISRATLYRAIRELEYGVPSFSSSLYRSVSILIPNRGYNNIINQKKVNGY